MIQLTDWGRIDYAQAWDKQKALFEDRVMAKQRSADCMQSLPDVAVFCEHPPVYTLGKSGKEENLLVSKQLLEARGVSFFRIERGGDITYHGPGQIVVYPIFDLEHFNIGLRQYIFKLEEAVIRFLATYHVKGQRLEGATGVWLEPDVPGKARKICAIGVKSSRYITMHGLALNINTDLTYFNYINPCGFTDKGVTSLARETGNEQSLFECREKLFHYLVAVFDN
ncbi:MAG: lipoyl(octanoyl) transferase LipB [Bacteroidota bacterium]|nr:lipoyl(octanoyl) transferase LipB [Bacteroidota bacterium]